jgi:WD40 repeat protein
MGESFVVDSTLGDGSMAKAYSANMRELAATMLQVAFVIRAVAFQQAIAIFIGWTIAAAEPVALNSGLMLVTERGHSDAVQATAFARRGEVAITVGGFEAVAWDLASDRELRQFRGHSNIVRAVAVNREDLVVTGSTDGTARVWDLATGAELRRFVLRRSGDQSLAQSVRAVAFTNDGRTIKLLDQDYGGLVSRRRQFVTAWDVHTGAQLKRFSLDSNFIDDAAFSRDSNYVAVKYTSIGASMVAVYDTRSGHMMSKTKVPSSQSNSSVLISPNNTQFVSLGSHEMTSYKLRSGRKLWYKRHEGIGAEILAAAYSNDGSRIFIATKDAIDNNNDVVELQSFNAETGSPLGSVVIGHTKYKFSGSKIVEMSETGTGSYIVSLSILPNGKQLFITTSKNQYVVDANLGSTVRTYRSNVQYIEDVALSEDFTRIAIETARYGISWDLRSETSELFPLSQQSSGSLLESSRTGFVDTPYVDLRFAKSSSSKIIATDLDSISEIDLTELKLKSTPRRMASGYVEAKREDGESSVISTFTTRAITSGVFGQEVIFTQGENSTAVGDPILVETRLLAIPGLKFNLFGPSPSLFDPTGKRVFETHDQKVCQLEIYQRTEMCFPTIPGASVTAFALSKDGTQIAITYQNGSRGFAALWSTNVDRDLLMVFLHPAGAHSVTFAEDHQIVTGDADGWVRKWDLGVCQKQPSQIGKFHTCEKPLWTIKAHDRRVTSLRVSVDYSFLLSGSSDGIVKFWRCSSGRHVATLVISPRAAGHDKSTMLSWVITDEDGRFNPDNLENVSGLHWAIKNDPYRVMAPEVFMRDYYEPRLLSRLLSCNTAEARGNDLDACKKALKEVRPLAGLNRIQPDVRIVKVERGASAGEAVVTVEMSGKEDRTQKNGKIKTDVYDLRLFRDGQIVGQWPEPRGGIGGAEDIATWRNETQVPMPAGQTKGTHQFRVKLASRDKGQPIRFTAYAFNEDRVKSETATDESYRVPDDIVPAEPRAYVITIGVNAYQNPDWRLGFAVKDAQDLSAALQRIEGYEVVDVPLVSPEYGSNLDQATKANIKDVVALLSGTGEAERERLKDNIGPIADRLYKVTPDDLVILAFSGHGYTDPQGRFYLLPSNSGADSAITDARLPKFISSEELSQWLREVDAGELVMIIDACHSAASVPEGFKPGPMGDRGLGQLAYDKGMQILAATQADNVALESAKLGQGLLTYALVDDGLKARKAAPEGNGPITIKAWLRYAEKRVPNLYDDIRSSRVKLVGFDPQDAKRELVARDSTVDPAFYTQTAQQAQTPALFDFYRRSDDPVLQRQ